MDAAFWHQRWASKQIAFHEAEVNPLLAQHLSALKLPAKARIFVPLCGKTHDIGYLLSQGYQVVGVELSDIAINELFEQLNLTPKIETIGDLTHYQHPGLDIFVGDIFALNTAQTGIVDAIYDRAALIALPTEMRRQYSQHLRKISQNAPQLLITVEYDQSLMAGPPFSLSATEIKQHYASIYSIECLASNKIEGGLKSVAEATETVWKLTHSD